MRGKIEGRYGPGRDAQPEEDDSSRWLGTYGDAVTLLMAFFVMLYAMSEVDAQKFTAFVSGLEGPFGNQAVTESMLPSNLSIVGPNTAAQQVPDVPSLDPDTPLSDLVRETGDDTGDEEHRLTVADEAQLTQVEEALDAALASQGLASVADYRLTTRGLVISIASDDVLFAIGSSQVSDVGTQIVTTLADVLADFPNDVTVEGHTDDLPLSRVGYSNWNLSTDRAVAVVDLLIRSHAFPADRLGAAGYADQRPRVPNDSPANRALNRRVDILIVAEGGTDG